MGIASSVLSILDFLKDKLPIASRLEKIKNDIDKLEAEKKQLLGVPANVRNSKRLNVIDDKLVVLRKRVLNSTGAS